MDCLESHHLPGSLLLRPPPILTAQRPALERGSSQPMLSLVRWVGWVGDLPGEKGKPLQGHSLAPPEASPSWAQRRHKGTLFRVSLEPRSLTLISTLSLFAPLSPWSEQSPHTQPGARSVSPQQPCEAGAADTPSLQMGSESSQRAPARTWPRWGSNPPRTPKPVLLQLCRLMNAC